MWSRKLFYLILLIGLVGININLMAQKEAKEQEWKSIHILYTTRSEVEKRFGEPTKGREFKFQSLYEQKDYNLLVYYTQGCTSNEDVDNYNVPPDTVKYLIVYLKKPISLSAFNIDITKIDTTKFEKTVSPQVRYLTDIDENVIYRLSGNDETSVISIDYRPKKEDYYRLACSKQIKQNCN